MKHHMGYTLSIFSFPRGFDPMRHSYGAAGEFVVIFHCSQGVSFFEVGACGEEWDHYVEYPDFNRQFASCGSSKAFEV